MDDYKRLFPSLNKNEFITEDFKDYCVRIQKEFPNLPEDIIEQWFFDHYQQIGDFVKEYPLAKFVCRKEFISTADLPFDHHYVAEELKKASKARYLKGIEDNTILGLGRIYNHIRDHGTWPRPIILLRNKDKLPQYSSPYHLIEGHKRLSVLCIYKDRIKILNEHEAWVCEISE